MSYKTTIVIENETRNRLKEVGKKQQTYDQLIRELLELKKGKMKLE
jgi:predicted CopG family antitoxin